MFLASSKDLGDIGNHDACNSLSLAKYWSFDINLKILPVNLILGLCLPNMCTKPILQEVSSKLNSFVYNSIQNVGIEYFTSNNFTIDLFF